MIGVKDDDTRKAVSLIENGADVNAHDLNGLSVANWATEWPCNSIDILDLLFKHGAHFDCIEPEGKTLLIDLVETYCELFQWQKLGLQQNKKLRSRFLEDRTPAMLWLLDHGANINQKDTSGHSALDYASSADSSLRNFLLRHAKKSKFPSFDH